MDAYECAPPAGGQGHLSCCFAGSEQDSLFAFALQSIMAVMAQRWISVLATVGAALAAVISSPTARDDAPTWQKYVRAPASTTVKPVAVLSKYTAGNIQNINGLVGSGSAGPTILTRESTSDPAPVLVLDFGQNIVGLLRINFAGSYSNGTSGSLPGVTLAFSETLLYLSARSDFTRSDNLQGTTKYTNGTDQIAVKTTPYSWIDQLGCASGKQVCADGLHGFRYVKISLAALAQDAPLTSAVGSVSIDSVVLESVGFQGTPDTFVGHFECSDPDLTQYWYDGVYTNDLATGVFIGNETEPRSADSPTLENKIVLFDGAKRDRDPYVGDVHVSGLTTYVSHDLYEAGYNVLQDLALHQRADGWIPPASIGNYGLSLFDYPLHWVVSSIDYVLYSGDTNFLKSYWSTLQRVLDNYYPTYISATTGVLVRASGYGDYAFLPRSGQLSYDNALYAYALKRAAGYADIVSKPDDASRWRARAASIGANLIKANFDKAVGAFFDGGPCGSNAMCPTHAQDGNSLAVLAGIVKQWSVSGGDGAKNTSDPTAEGVLGYLQSSSTRLYGNSFYDNSVLSAGFGDRVYAFLSFFEISARFITGKSGGATSTSTTAQSALDELRRMHGWMATNDPTITHWEGIGTLGLPYEVGFTSMAHGWSTGVVSLLSNHVLGVNPTAPGFAKWSINPLVHGTDITWARGVVPTPDGAGVSVDWALTGKTGYTVDISTPTASSGVLKLAYAGTGSASSVTVDGKVIFTGTKASSPLACRVQNGYVNLNLKGGQHSVVVVY